MTIKTPIGYTTRDEIFVRDRNIATEILGQPWPANAASKAGTGNWLRPSSGPRRPSRASCCR